MGYDEWLQQPCEDAMRWADEFAQFCDDEGLDPEDPSAAEAFDLAEEARINAMVEEQLWRRGCGL